ncbi:MAG: CHAT domain-containing protein [Vampirovibrionia bacterium]
MKNAGIKSVKIIEDNNLSENLSAALIYDQLSSLYNLGELYYASLDCLEKSLIIKKQYLPENHRQLGNTYNLIGNTFDSLEEYDRAIKSYQKAESIFKHNNDFYYLWQAYSNIGYTNQKQGNYQEALNYYDKSLNTLDLIINNSTIKEDKYYLAEQKRLIIENAIKSSLKLNLQEKALLYSEKVRYQDLLSDIARKKALLSISINKQDRFKLDELNNSLEKYEKLCPGNSLSLKNIKTEGLNAPGVNYNTSCGDKLKAKKSLDDYITNLSSKYSALNSILKDKLTSEIELKKLINNKNLKDKTIIEYMVGFNTLYTFIIFNGKVSVLENEIYHDELDKHIKDYNKPFRLVSLAKTNGMMLDILKKYNTKTSYELYKLLLEEPITLLKTEKNFSKDTNIIIIPDESLNYLSFGTLITNTDTTLKESNNTALSEYQYLPYFIKEYTLSYLPNLSISNYMHDVMPINSNNDNKFLIVGNPDTTYTKENNPEIARLGDLPFSENEAALIQNLFKNNSELIVGKQATEEKISHSLGQYQNYHFACHGIINEEEPLKSGIVLATDEYLSTESKEKGFDGILRNYEILTKNINANLVVLSACESGTGKLNSGEGVLGITRSFFISGTNAMVISLWKINDQSSSLLMSDFYNNMYKTKDEKVSEALRKAQIQIIKDKNTQFTCGSYNGLSFSHPYFWGAFIYSGI